MTGGWQCWIVAIDEEVVAAVDWNFQAHEADYLHQAVHHHSCLLPLPSEQQLHDVPQKKKDCSPNLEQLEAVEDEDVDQRSAMISHPHHHHQLPFAVN